MTELADLKKRINLLPKAEEREVYADEEELEDYKAVWNTTDDRLAKVVSDKYTILQHADFFGPVVDTVEQIKWDVENIVVKDKREAVFVEILFDRQFAAEGILAGIRAGNSFDKRCRAFVEAYALRQVCTNGMMGRELMGRASRFHIYDVSPEPMVEKVEEQISTAEYKLGELIRRAQVEKVDVAIVENALEGLKFGVRIQDKVLEEYKGAGEVSKWALYNATTEIVEHKDIRERKRETYHRKANKLLTKTPDELAKIAREVEEEAEEEGE